MAGPVCGACGGAMPPSGGCRIVGALAMHPACAEGIPAGARLMAVVRVAELQEVRRLLQDERANAARARIDRDEAQRAQAAADRELAAARRSMIDTRQHVAEVSMELRQQVERLEAEIARGRVTGTPAAAPRRTARAAADGTSSTLEKMALGLAWGRGIHGMAAWFATVVLAGMDYSEARYSLLELDGSVRS